jgi:hypothetical protein
MITLNAIRSASGSAAYSRGSQIQKSGKILQYKTEETLKSIQAKAKVQGSGRNQYDVSVRYNKNRDVIDDYQCECQAYYTYTGMCKHCVAVALELFYEGTSKKKPPRLLPSEERKKGREGLFSRDPELSRRTIRAKATDEELADIIFASSMKEKARYLQPELTGQVELVPVFEKQDRLWTVEFKIGAFNKYVVKNISRLAEAVHSNDWVEYGKKLAFYHERSVFTKESQRILGLLEQYITHEKEVLNAFYNHRGYPYYYSIESLTKRKLSLSEEWMVRFAQELKGRSFQVSGIGNQKELTFLEGNPVLKVAIRARSDGGYELKVPGAEVFCGQERILIRAGGTVYLCSQEFSEKMRVVGGLFLGREKSYTIHPEDASSFCAFVLPVLKQFTSCEGEKELEQYEPKQCRISVYLDRQNQEITAKAVCSYGEADYNIMEGITANEMHRDFEKEYRLAAVVKGLFPFADPVRGLYVLPEKDEEKVYHLLHEGISLLQQKGEVFATESFKRIQFVEMPKVRIGIAIKAGFLEVTVKAWRPAAKQCENGVAKRQLPCPFSAHPPEGSQESPFIHGALSGAWGDPVKTEQISPEEMAEILQGYRRKRKFYRLPDGTFLRLEDSGLLAVAEMAEGLELNEKQLTEGCLRVPGYRCFYLDQIFREQGSDIQVNRSQELKALLREMKNVEDSDFEEPEGLKAELRPYQRFGYRWMMTLQKLGFGGILADDMGLGKTVQAIAYLLAQKEGQQSQKGNVSPFSQESQRKKSKSEKDGTENSGEEPDRQYLGLVVCPASLVYNWESEIQKFAPSLEAVTVTGTSGQRKEKIEKGEGHILLTSYDLLKRDMECYQKVRFETVIIDEAQNIKNDTT